VGISSLVKSLFFSAWENQSENLGKSVGETEPKMKVRPILPPILPPIFPVLRLGRSRREFESIGLNKPGTEMRDKSCNDRNIDYQPIILSKPTP
jgi:hypothetical protein